MALLDIKKIEEDARKEIAEEASKKAKTALIAKMRELESAKQVVRNIETQLSDLRNKIIDGELN